MQPRSVGVEEELLVVDPQTGRPVPMAGALLERNHHPSVEGELMRQQVETQTEPCASLAELRDALAAERAQVAKLAAADGLAVAPLPVSPFPVRPVLTPNERYSRLVDRFGSIAGEQLSCGCHVHVSVASRAEGVGVIDRLRPWLATLLAISANSPYWQGIDTTYASYRSQQWGRWPTAGPTEAFGSVEAYDATVQALVDAGGALDRRSVYFDARLAIEQPTVEIRVADVCLSVDDVLLVAALGRGLVTWAAEEWAAGRPPLPVRTELLRAAAWRAARFGMTGQLVDPTDGRTVPAAEHVHRLVDVIGPALDRHDDRPYVARLVENLLQRGTGSERQRAAGATRGRLADVVSLAIREMSPAG